MRLRGSVNGMYLIIYHGSKVSLLLSRLMSYSLSVQLPCYADKYFITQFEWFSQFQEHCCVTIGAIDQTENSVTVLLTDDMKLVAYVSCHHVICSRHNSDSCYVFSSLPTVSLSCCNDEHLQLLLQTV